MRNLLIWLPVGCVAAIGWLVVLLVVVILFVLIATHGRVSIT